MRVIHFTESGDNDRVQQNVYFATAGSFFALHNEAKIEKHVHK